MHNMTAITQSNGSDKQLPVESHTYSNPSTPCSSIELAVTWGHHDTQTSTSDGVHMGHVHNQAHFQARLLTHPEVLTVTHRGQSQTDTAQTYPKAITQSHPFTQSHHYCHPQALSQDQSPVSWTHAHSLPHTESHHVHPESYLISNRKHQTVPGSQVVSITHVGSIPGHIDSESCACSFTYPGTGTLVPHGKEGSMIIAVQGNVQHTVGTGWEGGGTQLVSKVPLRHGLPISLTTLQPLPQPLTWGPPQICAEFHYHDGCPSPRSGS